jgi:hypothetical protein
MTTSTPPWIVRAWPPVVWPIHAAPSLHFVHLGTRVIDAGDAGRPSSGQTLWGGRVAPQGSAGVAWDWIELRRGVLAMADPLGLITNLQLVGTHGQVIEGLEAALRLNQLVNLLPWQNEVVRALGRNETSPQHADEPQAPAPSH